MDDSKPIPSVAKLFKPKSPKWVYVPKPVFKTTLELQRFREREKQRWVEGYGGLTGPHYFALQECKIRVGASSNIERPVWRDTDDILYGEIDKDMKAHRNTLIFKRREIGLTTLSMGIMPNYIARIHPNSTCVITSKDSGTLLKTFKDKTLTTYNNLDVEIRPTIVSKNQVKNNIDIVWQVPFKNSEGQNDFGEASIYCRETSDGPQSPFNFSGIRAIYGFIDEFPLHKRRDALYKSIIPIFMNGPVQEGYLLSGGSVEEGITNDELAKIAEFTNSAKALNTNVVMIPYWCSMFSVNGWSDKEKARIWWEQKCEELAKATDQSYLIAHKKNYPASLEELLELSGGGMFEEDVSAKLQMQTKLILQNPPPQEYVTLVKIGDVVHTVPAHKKQTAGGALIIFERPKQGCEYILVADGTATGTETGETEGSNFVGMIIKLADPSDPETSYSVVCEYSERPKIVEDSYRVLENQIHFYNVYGGFKSICPEANAGTTNHFSTFLKKEGLLKYIWHKKDLSGKGNVNTKKMFQNIGIHERSYQVRQANPFLRKRIQTLKSIRLLKSMLLPAEKNADERDAYLMLFVYLDPDFEKPVKQVQAKTTQLRMTVEQIDGKWVQRWK